MGTKSEEALVGKNHSEQDVIESLMRKRIFYTWTGGKTREYGKLYPKTIVISDNSDHVGNGTLGKLDFMKKKGWKVLDYRTTHQGTMSDEEKQEMKKLAKQAKKQRIKVSTYKNQES